MKIRHQLAISVLAAVLPLLIFSSVGIYLLLKEERRAEMERIREFARTKSLAVDRELTKFSAALRVLSYSNSLQKGLLEEFYERAQLSLDSNDTWIVLADKSGNQVLNTAVPFNTPLPKTEEIEPSSENPAPHKIIYQDLFYGPVKKTNVLSIDMQVPKGKLQGYVISQGILPHYFSHLLKNDQSSKDWIMSLVDRSGKIIARSTRENEFFGKLASAPLRDAITKKRESFFIGKTLEGIEVYTMYSTSELSGWTVAIGVPVVHVEATARRAIAITILGFLMMVGLASIAYVISSKRIIESIKDAEAAANELGLSGSVKPRTSSIEELNHLYGSLFNAGEMLEKEREQRMRFEQELEITLDKERLARQESDRQNKAKDEFMAMLGHELRNPLSPISTAAVLLQRQSRMPEKVEKLGEMIDRQVRHMSVLIDDLLDASRITRGLIILDKHPVDVKAIADVSIDQVRSIVDAKRHTFTKDYDTHPVCVLGDEKRLIQIISNLLTNAAKYTPEGGQIELSIKALNNEAVIEVKDNGIGIEDDLKPHIFEPFAQGKRGMARSEGGLGLGLALVKGLSELHSGKITCESGGAGLGSTFTLHLPILPNPQIENELLAQQSPIGRNIELPILIVDDNEDAANTIGDYLSILGYEVQITHSSVVALQQSEEKNFKVFIMDIGLPEMDGYALARAIRSNPRFQFATLIAITGYGQEADKQKAKAAGFDIHLTKPVEMAQLLEAIKHG